MSGPASGREHLRAIGGGPRPAGSIAEAAARAYCEEVLQAAGFAVRSEPFEYSAFPGRYATALGGLTSTLLLVVAIAAGSRGNPRLATLVLVAGGIALATAATWAARTGVLRAPLMRRHGSNLSAVRGTPTPAVWLVAHLDSKSQPVPILVRAGAIALHGATWSATLLLCGLEWVGASVGAGWTWLGVVAVASGAPIVASLVGERSAGAVDNASGVAAVLAAATMLPRHLAVGVVITSAEELGLAGARAWVRDRPPATALNCDGIDDVGELVCMFSGRKPDRLVASFERAARGEGHPGGARRLLPGVLVDGVAFADAGWQAITLSRGTIRTLARIHTRGDTLDVLRGTGVNEAAHVLTRLTRELC